MIIFSAYGQKATLKHKWSEITLEEGISLHRIAEKLPQTVKDIYRLMFMEQTPEIIQESNELENSLTITQKRKDLPIIYGEVILLLSDLPENVVKRMTPEERTVFYNDYLFNFVISVLFIPVDYTPTMPISFRFDNEVYYFPEHRMVLGHRKEMDKTCTLEFCEVADLEINAKELTGGVFERMANIIAILCRPDGEEYDEQTSLKRSEKFIKIPMNIVWEVFFYIVEHLSLLKTQNLLSSVERIAKQNELAKGQVCTISDGMQLLSKLQNRERSET